MSTKILLRPHATCLGRRTAAKCLASVCQSRNVTTQSRSQSTLTAAAISSQSSSSPPSSQLENEKLPSSKSPLETLPAYQLLRTLMITTITAQPTLSQALCKFLVKYSKELSENPITNYGIRKTFYDHFCAGNTKDEIQQTSALLKSWGIDGLSLAFAKEVESADNVSETAAESEEQINIWKDGTMKTVEYAGKGEFAAVKYTGAGSLIVKLFEENKPLPESYMTALDDICQLARKRGVGIMFDAEQTWVQGPMDTLTMDLMAKYNTPGLPPIVYNTYQTYLKSTTKTLQSHLQRAKDNNFIFGAKIVRGAYLHSEARHLIHDTKPDTDTAYDNAVDLLLSQTQPVGIVVATHNRDSVDFAHKTLLKKGDAFKGEMAFAQLMGMADELSMELVSRNERLREGQRKVSVIKYLPWGTVEECIKYLLRRADENQDAMKRTVDSQKAAWREIWRRSVGA